MPELARELQYVKDKGWLPFFQEEAYGCQPHILHGIGSRETNLKNILGDSGHGHGIMQIDDRSFPEWCASGQWRDPHKAIRMGAFVLASKCAAARVKIKGDDNILRAAIASYNAGKNAIDDFLLHGDPDRRTTGHDYSRDVLRRAAWFKAALGLSTALPPAMPEQEPSQVSWLERIKNIFS